ncbi:MAG: S-layer homology domain-containing protein, partial [Clostridia bacterium]|nr:S-layer homology domain-containing protein [Clostridia bacterium]
MKKVLSVLLCLALLVSVCPFGLMLAAEAVGDGVTVGRPDGKQILITHTTEDGFYKKQGETPWGFEHAPVGTDKYEPLEYIQTGWYYEKYQNWAQGAIQHPISMHAGTVADPIVSFTCPSDGTILIHESYCGDLGETYSGDGVQFMITKNSKNIYPREGWIQVLKENVTIPDLTLEVKKGDVIRFRLNCIETQKEDGIHWTKKISYLGDTSAIKPVEGVTFGQPEDMTILATHTAADGFSAPKGTTPWGFEHAPVNTDNYESLEYIQTGWYYEKYQNWAQGAIQHPISMHAGMIADPVVSFTAPSDGTLMIHASYCGDLGETYSGDGVQFKILKNDQQLYPSVGWVQVLDSKNVEIPDLVFTVKKGDVIRFRLNCIANQKADGIHWTKTISYLTPANSVEPAAGVTSPIPEGTLFGTSTKSTDAFESNEGTDWVYQNVAIGGHNYSNLQKYSNTSGSSYGWFAEKYQNWSAGAIPYRGYLHPGMSGDSAFTYVCPQDGTLAILPTTIKVDQSSYDGCKVAVLKNDQNVYPAIGMIEIKPGRNLEMPGLILSVKKGDQIHFRSNVNASQQAECTRWDPEVAYVTGMGEVEEKAIFNDLTDHWARESVEALFEKNIVKGKGEGIFDPEAQVTRAEFLTMVQKAAKLPTMNYKPYFNDVPMDAWFTSVITSAHAYDIIADELVTDGNLNPDAPILREEMTSIMVDTMQNTDYRALGSGDLSMFSD